MGFFKSLMGDFEQHLYERRFVAILRKFVILYFSYGSYPQFLCSYILYFPYSKTFVGSIYEQS